MTLERDVLSQFAGEIAERIACKTIAAPQRVTDTLSGDDSGLANWWEEFCVQIQYEQSLYWDDYDETVRSFVALHVEELEAHEGLGLWSQTEQGRNWLDDGESREEHPPVFEDGIVRFVVSDHVYSKAGGWTNRRIRAYLDGDRSADRIDHLPASR